MDLTEKNQQILLMGSIYQQAKEVVAWVGAADENTAEAASLTEVLSSKEEPPTDEMIAASLVHFRSLLHREYWTRVWIIQELSLAQSLTIHCGQWQISWPKFSKAFEVVVNTASKEKIDEQLDYGHIKGLFELKRDQSANEQGQPMTLMRALQLSCGARSSDPWDKVFSLLGLVVDGKTYVPAPSYKQSVEDLCRGITLSFIATKGLLDPIVLLGRGCEDASVVSNHCPSWVPRWTSLDGVVLRRQLNYMTGNGQPFWGSPVFHLPSCAGGEAPFRLGLNDDILTCRGTQVGYIEVASLSTTNFEDSQLTECFNLNQLPNPYGSKEKTFMAIYCTFLCIVDTEYKLTHGLFNYQRSSFERSVRRAYLPEFLRMWRSSYQPGFNAKTQGWIEAHRTFTIHGCTIESWARWMTWRAIGMYTRVTAARYRQYHLLADVQHYILPDLAIMIESGMRLIITDKGHIGWAHPRGRKGDELYVLKGCSVAVILRPRPDGGYLIVGDA